LRSKEKLNVAVIGTGHMGVNHARLYRQIKTAKLVAICDSDPTRAREVSRTLHVPAYIDVSSMLEKERLDAVSVAVPTKDHYEAASAAIKSGISVLVEKPLVDNVRSGRLLIDLAKKSKVILMVGHLLRFNPAVNLLKRTLKEHRIGGVIACKFSRIGPRPSRMRAVGAVEDLAVHDFDLARYLFESEVDNLKVHLSFSENRRFERYALITMRLENGIIVTSENAWLRSDSFSQRGACVIGTDGVVAADFAPPRIVLYNDKGISRPCVTGNTLKLELEHFLYCVKNHRKPRATGEDGLAAVQLVRRALKLGQN
jgi:UDP-N-acetylglucosamine 3-dehydrogenase